MTEYTVAGLAAELDGLRFERFGYVEAWELGRRFQERALEGALPAAISVFLGEQRAFHAAAPGSSADNDDWILRKARTVARFRVSSLAVRASYEERGKVFAIDSRLDPSLYTDFGGGYPLIAAGSLVGAVAVSGLPHLKDHELVTGLLSDLLVAAHD